MYPWRFRRERWLLLIAVPVISAVLCGFAGARIGDSVSGAVVGAIVGLCFGAALLVGMIFVDLPGDTRVAAVGELRPGALVANVPKRKQLLVRLVELADPSFDYTTVTRSLAVSFDSTGMTFWTGARSPVAFLAIPPSRIESIGLGSYSVKTAGNAEPQAFQLEVDLRNEVDESVRLHFPVEKVPRFPSTTRHMSESEILEFAVAARAALNNSVAAPAPASTSYVSAGLEPGLTAWAAGRLGPIPSNGLYVLSFLLFLPIAAAFFFQAPPLLIVLGTVLWLLPSAVLFGLFARQGRATKRERAAGYTTLNGENLTLEQRHPSSGRVLRTAGSPALSKEQFAQELAR